MKANLIEPGSVTAGACTTEMDPLEPSSKLAQDIAKQIRAQLRLSYPYMKIEAIEEIARACRSTITNGVEAQRPAMAASRRRISFLDLPPELRDQIYEAALVEKKVCTGRPGQKFAQPALTRVSRQIREEALPVFYGMNSFQFEMSWTGVDYDVQNIYLQISQGVPIAVIVRGYEQKSDRIARPEAMGRAFGWLETIGAHRAAMVGHLDLVLPSLGNFTHPDLRIEPRAPLEMMQEHEAFAEFLRQHSAKEGFALPRQVGIMTEVPWEKRRGSSAWEAVRLIGSDNDEGGIQIWPIAHWFSRRD